MRVGIVAQRANERAASLAADLRDLLREDGVAVDLDEETAAALELDGIPPARVSAGDLVVSIGGDGTFLFAARHAGTTPVLGVNLGEVGFLNAVAPERAGEAVRRAVAAQRERGAVPAREVPRLVATGGESGGQEADEGGEAGEAGEGDEGDGGDEGDRDGWRLSPAINEVVVQGARRGRGGGLHVEVRVDGDRYAASHADGVLVSTPTGSTAYNLSEGGPLVHPDVDGLVVTLMCAADPMPPLVVPLESEVALRVDDAGSAVVASDGRDRRTVEPPATVSVTRAAESARVAGPGSEFFAALSKLE